MDQTKTFFLNKNDQLIENNQKSVKQSNNQQKLSTNDKNNQLKPVNLIFSINKNYILKKKRKEIDKFIPRIINKEDLFLTENKRNLDIKGILSKKIRTLRGLINEEKNLTNSKIIFEGKQNMENQQIYLNNNNNIKSLYEKNENKKIKNLNTKPTIQNNYQSLSKNNLCKSNSKKKNIFQEKKISENKILIISEKKKAIACNNSHQKIYKIRNINRQNNILENQTNKNFNYFKEIDELKINNKIKNYFFQGNNQILKIPDIDSNLNSKNFPNRKISSSTILKRLKQNLFKQEKVENTTIPVNEIISINVLNDYMENENKKSIINENITPKIYPVKNLDFDIKIINKEKNSRKKIKFSNIIDIFSKNYSKNSNGKFRKINSINFYSNIPSILSTNKQEINNVNISNENSQNQNFAKTFYQNQVIISKKKKLNQPENSSNYSYEQRSFNKNEDSANNIFNKLNHKPKENPLIENLISKNNFYNLKQEKNKSKKNLNYSAEQKSLGENLDSNYTKNKILIIKISK